MLKIQKIGNLYSAGVGLLPFFFLLKFNVAGVGFDRLFLLLFGVIIVFRLVRNRHVKINYVFALMALIFCLYIS